MKDSGSDWQSGTRILIPGIVQGNSEIGAGYISVMIGDPYHRFNVHFPPKDLARVLIEPGAAESTGPDGDVVPTWTLYGGDNVTATVDGITIGPFSIASGMTRYFRADALKILAAIAACERLQANTEADE